MGGDLTMIVSPGNIECMDSVADDEAKKGYASFLPHVVVDAQPQKNLFGLIAEKWQWRREHRSAPAIDHLAGITGHYDGPLSFWHGYHKGSDKTHAIARKLIYLLAYARKRLRLYACAGDRDQAALITLAMTGVLEDNEWLAGKCDVATYGATGASGSTLTVLAMDSYTNQGIFPDYIVAEEITHWLYDEGRTAWNFVLSSVNKRPGCVFEVCTNAGHIGTWQWNERNRISKSKFWSFYEAPVGAPLPKWMNQEKIDDDSQGMDPGERDRLYKNRWIDPGEENGYIATQEAEACVDPELEEKVSGEPHLRYYAIVDYGEVNDRTALCVLHNIPGTDECVIDRLDCWQGSHERRVLIDIPEDWEGRKDGKPPPRSVEGWLEITRRNFKIASVVFDKFQMSSLAQKYMRRNVRVELFEYNAGKRNYAMAQLLRNMVQNRKLTWSAKAGYLEGAEDDTFAKELGRLVKKVMVYGYRFDHESGAHDDRAAAVGMGLIFAVPETRPAGSMGPKAVKAAVVENQQSVPKSHQDWASARGLFGMGRR